MEAHDLKPNGVVLAVAAHPDDIEFMMGGTLRLLADAGWEAHYLALADGSLGHEIMGPTEISLERTREAQEAASDLKALWHPPIAVDSSISCSIDLVRRVVHLLRLLRPSVVLTHPPDDYLDDHVETSRLVVKAAFNRAMPNFVSVPPAAPTTSDIAVYHAQPHGLRDQLRRLIVPDIFVDVESVLPTKVQAIKRHQSQQEYLSTTQGFESMSSQMLKMGMSVGRMSKNFIHAEGWRQHLHLGLSKEDRNPLAEALGSKVESTDQLTEVSFDPQPRSSDRNAS